MSVLPNPRTALDEAWRVLRPGGTLVVMNHFAAPAGVRGGGRAPDGNASAWLGWHPNFPYAAVGGWIGWRPDARMVERASFRR